MGLLPEITVGLLRSKTVEEIRRLPCIEVITDDGEYIATLVVPALEGGASIYEHIRTQTEYLGVQSNSVHPGYKGEEADLHPATIGISPLSLCECGFQAKSPFGLMSHRRIHKEPACTKTLASTFGGIT